MAAPPEGLHLRVAHVRRVAERRGTTGPAIGAPPAAGRAVPRRVVGAGAGPAGGEVRVDARAHDGFPHLSVGWCLFRRAAWSVISKGVWNMRAARCRPRERGLRRCLASGGSGFTFLLRLI